MKGDWNVWQTVELSKTKNSDPIFQMEEQCRLAFEASHKMCRISSDIKDRALEGMAVALMAKSDEILAANEQDIIHARTQGFSKHLLDRLTLTPGRLKAMAESLRVLSHLSDPIGEVLAGWSRPNGLQIQKVRVPLGVIGIIYEARPNVTSDAIGVSIKSGNSVVLSTAQKIFFEFFL